MPEWLYTRLVLALACFGKKVWHCASSNMVPQSEKSTPERCVCNLAKSLCALMACEFGMSKNFLRIPVFWHRNVPVGIAGINPLN